MGRREVRYDEAARRTSGAINLAVELASWSAFLWDNGNYLAGDMTATLNLIIQQGATLSKLFEFRKTLVFRRALKPGDTTIYCQPLTAAIPSGFPLVVGDIDVVLTSVAPIGSVAVSIIAYSGSAVPSGTAIDTVTEDFTGTIWRGMIRKTYKDPAPLATLAFDVLPLSGMVTTILSATVTAGMLPNAQYSDIGEGIEAADQSGVSPDLWGRAYFWDMEYQDAVGKVVRVINGRCWVTYEATR